MFKKTRPFVFVLLLSFQLHANIKSAEVAAQTDKSCQSIQPFYWEIGTETGKVGSGSVGSKDVNEKTEMRIASASKWIFATYVLQKKEGQLTDKEKNLLRMLGGYDELKILPCIVRSTVKACYEARGNDHVESSYVGKFRYSGSNAQLLAIDLGLGGMNTNQLAIEFKKELKNKFNMGFQNLSLAGGMKTTPADYAIFLQEIMKGTYQIKKFLGADSVCTDPKTCKMAIASPAEGRPWLYSYHHWVELTEDQKTDVYSSPGLLGFYPWISADQKNYGIVAREKMEKGAWIESSKCGQAIRKAFYKKSE